MHPTATAFRIATTLITNYIILIFRTGQCKPVTEINGKRCKQKNKMSQNGDGTEKSSVRTCNVHPSIHAKVTIQTKCTCNGTTSVNANGCWRTRYMQTTSRCKTSYTAPANTNRIVQRCMHVIVCLLFVFCFLSSCANILMLLC